MPSLGSLTLPVDPVWVDEFGEESSPVVQTVDYSLSGAEIIQEAVKLAGIPITLDLAWLTRAEMLALKALADVANTQYTLTIPQGVYTVAFRRPPYKVQSIREVADPDSTDLYQVTVNLRTV
ncbi:MAG: hypothetical protein H6974_11050 [Gammaproteobacteria bacterium]|nr:hypothetical protein [Gammaproteobacteria bacterium]